MTDSTHLSDAPIVDENDEQLSSQDEQPEKDPQDGEGKQPRQKIFGQFDSLDDAQKNSDRGSTPKTSTSQRKEQTGKRT